MYGSATQLVLQATKRARTIEKMQQQDAAAEAARAAQEIKDPQVPEAQSLQFNLSKHLWSHQFHHGLCVLNSTQSMLETQKCSVQEERVQWLHKIFQAFDFSKNGEVGLGVHLARVCCVCWPPCVIFRIDVTSILDHALL